MTHFAPRVPARSNARAYDIAVINKNLRAFLVLATVVVLIAAACTSESSEATTTTETPRTSAVLDTTTTEVPPESAFEATDCDELGLSPEVTVKCGFVEVPANYETGAGSLKLAVAVLASTAASPAPDPVIYLEGGPGGHALDTMQFRMDDFFVPLAERSDVIVFDQRGAGRSRPGASCSEFDDLLLAEARSEDKSSPAEMAQATVDVVAACSERLRSEGVPIDDLNTANNAKDVNAIREALGYRTLNLLGISYGTRLGLEVVSQFPETSRSLILDSVFPHPVDAAVENPAAFAASYDKVVAACAAEPECAAEGDLGLRIEAAVAQLEADPLEIEVVDFITASTDTIYVDGDALLSLINSSLYSPQSFTDFPELMAGIEQGDPSALSLYASVDRANSDFLTTGMFLAVACADEYSFSNRTDVLAALPEDRFGLVPPEIEASVNFDQCDAFTTVQSDPVMNEPVSSAVPTLVMAGEFDPATPVAWAKLAARTLSNSQTVVFPGESHGVSPTKCGLQIVMQFLTGPSEPIDSACADDYVPLFLASAAPESLEFESIDVSFGGSPATVVVPTEWSHSTDGFISDARRAASILDSAEMLHFAGAAGVVSSVDTTLEAQFGGNFGQVTDRTVDGEIWQSESFSTPEIAVTAFKSVREEITVVIYMFSSVAEHSALVETVLVEAASGFSLQ